MAGVEHRVFGEYIQEKSTVVTSYAASQGDVPHQNADTSGANNVDHSKASLRQVAVGITLLPLHVIFLDKPIGQGQ